MPSAANSRSSYGGPCAAHRGLDRRAAAPAWLADRYVCMRDEVDARSATASRCCSTAASARCALATQLLGRFNAENLAVVIGCLLALGVPLGDAAAALGAMRGAAGAHGSDRIRTARGKPLAVVDYAHTPDALAKALRAAARALPRRAVVRVRLRRRPRPGQTPADGRGRRRVRRCDHRHRRQSAIRGSAEHHAAPSLRGIKAHAARVIHDRGEAIAAALNEAAPRDVVLIAGKGHEDYQIYGDARRSFSDRGRGAARLEGGGMKRTLGDAAQAARRPRWSASDQRYSVVSSDSRTLGPGALFVALRGPKFDGADFVGGRRSRAARSARWSSAQVPLPLCRRSSSPMRCARCSGWLQHGARISPFRSSAWAAATARPRPRK